MAERYLPEGSNEPAIKVRVADENGLVDLTTADKIELEAISDEWVIEGEMSVIDPPETVRIGGQLVQVNARYVLEDGDSDHPGAYLIRVKVTRDEQAEPPRVEFFPSRLAARESLIVEAAPIRPAGGP